MAGADLPKVDPMSQFRRPADTTMLRRDAALAVALGLGGGFIAVLTKSAQIFQVDRAAWQLIIASILLAAPLMWRRRLPSYALLATSVVYIAALQLSAIELTVSQVVLFLSFYSVGAWEPNRRRAMVVRAVVVVAMAVTLLISAISGFYDPETGEYGVQAYFSLLTIQVAVNAAYFVGAWFFGDRSWQQALERERLERAQAEIRAQQAQLTEQAISLERLRIARELHDVVAHHVSAMGIQAGAARRVLDRDPESAASALRSVEASARAAISELGTMVGALRSQDDGDAPMPRLVDVRDLVAASREHVRVEYEVVGTSRPLSAAVELTAYRVIQEALTNVRKHAGAGARADVRLRYLDDALEVEVGDDGHGSRMGAATGLGVGQTGMRERVTAVGGTIEMGPKGRGGYLVRARIPTGSGAVLDSPLRTVEQT